ncbi:hypothetical protein F4X90_19460 [Candidatus Poribacteria bacterium]|nr:hypothetical protein [Candidatus Poribacteria bacterium]
MSRAEYPNRNALRDANDIYLDTMRPFIIHHLKQVPGETVEDLIGHALTDEQADKFWEELDKDNDIESAIDFSYFPLIIKNRWLIIQNRRNYGFAQRFNEDMTVQSMLWLIKDGRNSCEHRGKKDLDSEFVRINLFLIADVLGKINRPDKQHEVEAIRDELFSDDTAERLEKAEEDNVEYKRSLAEAEQLLATAESEKSEYGEKSAALSKQVDEKENQRKKLDRQLKTAKTQNDKYKKDIAGKKQRLKESEAAQVDHKNRLETTLKELKRTHAERKETEEHLATALNQLAAVQAAEKDSAVRLGAVQNLFTVVAIGEPEVQEVFQSVYPPIETDSTIRILDRRGVDKKNYLLDLIEQKQPAVIYVQSEEMADLLLERVVPEKADLIEKRGEQTSEAEETEILEKLGNGELIAVVSDTTLTTLTSSHCIEHFVFCHLVPGLDEFFRQCEPAFASEKHVYLHLIYNSGQDIEGLAQKYPDRKILEKLYPELRKLAGANGGYIRLGSVYNELDIAKPGIETGLAIFEELQLLERNDEGIKLLPPAGKKLDASEIYRRGEQLKSGAADFQAFQFEQSIEQIWEALLKELNVDNENILEASSVYEVRVFQDAIEDSEAQSEPSTDAVENDNKSKVEVSEAQSEPSTDAVEDDNTVDGEDAETKPARANAKVTEEQVREIRSRSAAGESNSELAEEDSGKKSEVKQSEFWQPIRDGKFGGLFTGKPVPISNEGWITKTIRNIGVCLYLTNQRCYVQIYFHGANGSERREKIMTLFPKSEYTYAYRDSPRETKVQFPVLDKGRKDQDDWDEIREKLVAIGTDIYNKIDASDL